MKGFPLIIKVNKAIYKESLYNRDKLVKVAKKLHWKGLRKTVLDMGQPDFPEKLKDIIDDD